VIIQYLSWLLQSLFFGVSSSWEVILLLSITWWEKVPFDGKGCVSFGVGNIFLEFGLVLGEYGLWRD